MQKTKQVALGGMISALCITLMLIGGMMPQGRILFAMAAGFLVMIAVVEIGRKPALCVYLSTAALCLLFVPDRQLAVWFIFFYGHYSLLKQRLDRLPTKIIEYSCKLLVYTVSTLCTLAVLFIVLGGFIIPEWARQFGPLAVLAPIVGNVLIFTVYDFVLAHYYSWYLHSLRPKLFKHEK